MGISVIFVIRGRKKKNYPPKSMSRIKNIILTGLFSLKMEALIKILAIFSILIYYHEINVIKCL